LHEFEPEVVRKVEFFVREHLDQTRDYSGLSVVESKITTLFSSSPEFSASNHLNFRFRLYKGVAGTLEWL